MVFPEVVEEISQCPFRSGHPHIVAITAWQGKGPDRLRFKAVHHLFETFALLLGKIFRQGPSKPVSNKARNNSLPTSDKVVTRAAVHPFSERNILVVFEKNSCLAQRTRHEHLRTLKNFLPRCRFWGVVRGC